MATSVQITIDKVLKKYKLDPEKPSPITLNIYENKLHYPTLEKGIDNAEVSEVSVSIGDSVEKNDTANSA